MIMGWWVSNYFMRYIRIQINDLSKGIINLMTNKQAFYMILEADIIYHTPGKDDTEPNRLN